MISNFHTASSGPGSDDYHNAAPYNYTFSGFDGQDPLPKTKAAAGGKGGKAGKKGASSSRKTATPTPTSTSTSTSTNVKDDKKHRRRWGRGRLNSADTTSDSSNGGLSLTYSAGSSVQSTGESTDSSSFGDILKVLDHDTASSLLLQQQQHQQQRSSGGGGGGGGRSINSNSKSSVAPSLDYSDTDGESSRVEHALQRAKLTRGYSSNSNYSTDYSTDQESQLEGAKLINILMDDPNGNRSTNNVKNKYTHTHTHKNKNKSSPSRLLGDDESSEDEPFDMLFEAARTPNRRSTSGSTKKTPAVAPPTKKQVIAPPPPPPAATSATSTTTSAMTTAPSSAASVQRTNSRVSSGGGSGGTTSSSSQRLLQKTSSKDGSGSVSSRRSSGTRRSNTSKNSRQQPASQGQGQGSIPYSRSSSELGQHRSLPKQEGRTRRQQEQSSSSSKRGNGPLDNLYLCGAELLDDALPPKVKTMLRPFLCGVI